MPNQKFSSTKKKDQKEPKIGVLKILKLIILIIGLPLIITGYALGNRKLFNWLIK